MQDDTPVKDVVASAKTFCRRFWGAVFLLYGVFNTYLFVRFTPVYTAATCGDEVATLDHLNVGDEVSFGLKIEVKCHNHNSYQVDIASSRPGGVSLGHQQDHI